MQTARSRNVQAAPIPHLEQFLECADVAGRGDKIIREFGHKRFAQAQTIRNLIMPE
jgi:hypothetical protein